MSDIDLKTDLLNLDIYNKTPYRDGQDPPLNAENLNITDTQVKKLTDRSNEHTSLLNIHANTINTVEKKITAASDAASGAQTAINTHIGKQDNPHKVTAEQVGLGNVDNKSVETIKIEFTGEVSAESNGFVTGVDVYNAIASASAKPVLDNKSVIYNEKNQIALKQAYVDYLEDQLTPQIMLFEIGSGDKEVGTTVTVSSFRHAEYNIDNINGKLTLKRGSTILMSQIEPESYLTTVTLLAPDIVTGSQEGAIVYTLVGEDSRKNEFKKTVSFDFYFPSYVGAATNPGVDATDVASFTKVASKSLRGTRSIDAANEYVYFITTESINSIKSGGFDVSYTQLNDLTLSINGVNKSYHVYHTIETILSTMSYIIT